MNPNSNRPELGPDSAGSRIGVCWPEGGLETVSITDLDVVLGRVNPDFFLGGQVQLDPERARHEVERQVAKPLGLGVEEAAAGVIELFEETLKNEAVGRILGKGYSPTDYALLCYGGGGPLHVAGYTDRRPLPRRARAGMGRGLLGLRLRLRRLRVPLRPDHRHADPARLRRRDGEGRHRDDDHRRLARPAGARGRGVRQVRRRSRGQIHYTHAVRMQYYGQLNDIEIVSPHLEMEEGEHVDELIAEFEDAYAKVYASSARSPELGYLVTQAIVLGAVEVEKPALPKAPDGGQPEPQGSRRVWWDGEFADSAILDLEAVGSGQVIEGPAVLESAATTFTVPPGRSVELDPNQIFHLS